MVKFSYNFLVAAFIPLMSLISCGNAQQSKSELEVYKYTDSISVLASPTSKQELPPVLEYGKIVAPVYPDSMKAEQNLLSQVATYNSALLHGDVNTCASFLYPDAFEYCRQFYPDFPDDEVVKEFFKTASGELQEALVKWNEMGVEFEIVVANLERRISYGNDIIIVFNVTSNQCSDNVFIHSTELDNTIGISQNNGTNWWFMTNHEDLPTILKKTYPQDVVNAVMGY